MYKSNLLSNFHFADDSTGLAKGSNIVEVGNFVNTELQKLFLDLNIYFMLIHLKI